MNQVGVFAKYWLPGTVKTRLAESVGAQTAADLYQLFLRLTLVRTAQAVELARPPSVVCVLAYAPPERQAAFADLGGDFWTIEPQSEGSLGGRMSDYFENAFSKGCQKVLLIGSDSPDLPQAILGDALRRLDSASVVLGPSKDGGYYLIGMNEFRPDLFESIAWSTTTVFAQTVAALESSGTSWSSLPVWYDVDQFSDLRRLRQELSKGSYGNDTVAMELRDRLGDVLDDRTD